MQKKYEIRDSIHGFISFNDWERDIINHEVFQRTRKIRQLSLTDMVYPGAMHTRFEHSLGVMHIATHMYDAVVEKSKDLLCSELNYKDSGFARDRQLVRLAALLHDVGHSPFSHAGEELMPINQKTGKKFKHEDYSAAAVLFCMQDVIEGHKDNENYNITAQDIADFLIGGIKAKRALLWKSIISSQLDADRSDYLLRDSHHIGVAYGKFDLHRIMHTLMIAIDPEDDSPKLAIEDGGLHAAESLILARYLMFTQVYFQHTRRSYDKHLCLAMQMFLNEAYCMENATFPPPDSEKNVKEYLSWDDWKVLGLFAGSKSNEHAEIIRERKHYRKVFETTEHPDSNELAKLDEIDKVIGVKKGFIDAAKSSWYKFDSADIPIYLTQDNTVRTLSELSSALKDLKAINQIRIYSPPEYKNDCISLIKSIRGN